ncbi:MAG: efflux transporter outer membrane subunit [Chlamydiota bacterium]
MRRLSLFIGVLLSGCALSPVQEAPDISLSTHYTQALEKSSAAEDLSDWWTHFSDPNLDHLIALAKERNYDLQTAYYRIEAVRGRYRTETGNLWPAFSLSASAIRSRISQNLFDASFLGPAEQSLFQWGFDAFWEWDFFGKLRAKRAAAGYDVLQEEEEFRDLLLVLCADVARTYVDICTLQADLTVLSNMLAVRTALYDLQEEKYRSGLAPLQILEEERASLYALERLYVERNRALQTLHHHLSLLLGETPEEPSFVFSGTEEIPQAPLFKSVGIPSDLLRRRPDIRKAEYLIAASSRRSQAAVAELFPRFSLEADWGFAANKFPKWLSKESNNWNVGPFFSMPICEFGRILGAIDEQDALLQAALSTYQQTVLTALEDTENALTAYGNALITYELSQREFMAKQEEALLEETLFMSGLNSALTSLQAELQMLEKKRVWIESKRNASTQLIALYKALGGGWSC